MLNSGIVFSLLMLLCISSAGKTRTIEKPLFWARTIGNVEVQKVVVDDAETIIYMEVVGGTDRVNGIDTAIYLVAGGERYKLKEARGIRIAPSILTPAVLESENAVFELVFPPLSTSVETIDLLLARTTKSLQACILGIQLNEDKKRKVEGIPSALVKRKLNRKWEWQPPVYQAGRTRLDIYFLGYYPQNIDEGVVTWGGLVPGAEKFVIPADGHVVLEFDQYLTAQMTVEFAGSKLGIVVDPGEKATFYFDVQEVNLRNSVYFQKEYRRSRGYFAGKRMDLNQWLLERQSNTTAIVWDKEFGIDPERYITLCIEQYQKTIERIDSDRSLGEGFRYYAQLEAQLEYLNRVIGMNNYFRKIYNLAFDDNRTPRATPEYFSRLKELNLTSYDFALQNASVLSGVLNYFREKDVKSYFGEGYFSDLQKAQVCATRFVQKLPLRDEDLANMKTASPKAVDLFEMVYEESQKAWEAHIAKPGYRICETPDVPDSELFETMMKVYRGKVVVVDFWGTYCGPCIKAMKQIKPLKKELKDQPIAYVYIAGGKGEPTELWRQMIPDIGSDHFYLNQKSNKALIKQFNMSGQPFYVILDKKGNIVYTGSGFMGCDKMKKILIDLVNK